MEGTVCAICHTSQDGVDNITHRKLLVNNDCGHRFCESCCDRNFSRKKHFSCPVPDCKATVRRQGLSEKSVDEIWFSREVNISKTVRKIYNKTEEEFDSLDAYNDYLEEVEDIVFNLSNKIDVEAMKEKIRAYEEQHRDEIVANQARDMDTRRMIEQEIAAQQQSDELRRHEMQAELSRIKLKRNKLRQEATEVALGERDAVSSKLNDVMILGEGAQGNQELAQAALGARHRAPLQMSAPLPEQLPNSSTRRLYADMPPRRRAKLQRSAGAAMTKTDHEQSCWREAMSSLFVF